MVKIYAIALYVRAEDLDTDPIQHGGTKRLVLRFLRETTAEELTKALVAGIQDNHKDIEYRKLQPKVEQLVGVMNRVGKVQPGAQISLDYVPGRGTEVRLNGEAVGDLVSGDDIFPAILKIWIGDKPATLALKNSLLGRTK